jgi:glucose 1-dehydrogenase
MTARLLEGQRALVTGASSGIGRAVAIALGAAGARVVVNFLSNPAKGDAVVAAVRAAGGGDAIAVRGDVAKPEDCIGLFDAARERFGGVDIVVANAGIQRDAPFAEMTLAQWQQVLDVNLTGQFVCAQEAVRQFRRQGRTPASRALGKIIFTNSVHQVIPWAGHANYATAKGGLKLLMKTMAQELAAEGIRVNAIAPGAIRTEINRPAWETREAEAALLKLIPYGRVGDPEDVARAAVWLASDDSDYVVGTTLFVDGGMTLYPSFRDAG